MQNSPPEASQAVLPIFSAVCTVDNILGDGAARLLPIVTETMGEVKEKIGLA
jgi:hypothetical protein